MEAAEAESLAVGKDLRLVSKVVVPQRSAGSWTTKPGTWDKKGFLRNLGVY